MYSRVHFFWERSGGGVDNVFEDTKVLAQGELYLIPNISVIRIHREENE